MRPSGDCAALFAVTVAEWPHVQLVELREAPEGARDWRVPVVEVEDAIRAACTRWRDLEVAADSYRWVRSLELLDGEGILVGEYRSHPPAWPGTSRFSAAVVDRLLTHDGSPPLARHVANAILKEELPRRPAGQGAQGLQTADRRRRDGPRPGRDPGRRDRPGDLHPRLRRALPELLCLMSDPRMSKRPRDHP
jgi:hypothetical protein